MASENKGDPPTDVEFNKMLKSDNLTTEIFKQIQKKIDEQNDPNLDIVLEKAFSLQDNYPESAKRNKKGWFEVDELKEIDQSKYRNWYSTKTEEATIMINWLPSNIAENLKDPFKKGETETYYQDKKEKADILKPYFLTKNVRGDGLCLIRSVNHEITINRNKKIIPLLTGIKKKGVTRGEIIGKILNVVENLNDDDKKKLKELKPSYLTALNLDAGKKSDNTHYGKIRGFTEMSGDFSTLDDTWITVMATIANKPIYVFVDNNNIYKDVYPVKRVHFPIKQQTEKKKLAPNDIDRAIFIVLNGNHYSPLKVKKKKKLQEFILAKTLRQDPVDENVYILTTGIVEQKEDDTGDDTGDDAEHDAEDDAEPEHKDAAQHPAEHTTPPTTYVKKGGERLIIIKKSDLFTERQNLVKDHVSKEIKESENKRFVFKPGFLENLKEYYVLTDKYPKKIHETPTPEKSGHLVYRELFSLDNEYKYIKDSGEEVIFPAELDLTSNIIKLNTSQQFKFDRNNNKYYDLRRQYLNSQYFVTLDSFLDSDRFNDRAATRMEKTTYRLRKNIFFLTNQSKFTLVPFSFEPDKASIDHINENITKDEMELTQKKIKLKEKRENVNNEAKLAGMITMGAGTMSVAQLIMAGSVAGGLGLGLGVLSGGIGLAIGAGVYATHITDKARRKANDPLYFATRLKRQLHRIVHIITFATELKRKYKKDQHLIDEWKNTLINIHLKRIYDNMARDSVTNKLNFEAESALSSERKEAQEKIKKEKKKGYFGRRRERKKIKKLEKQQQAQTQTQAQMFRK